MKSFKVLAALLSSKLLSTSLALPTDFDVPCTRTFLAEGADAYVSTQSDGSFEYLSPLVTSNWTYLENNVAHPTTNTTPPGILSRGMKIDHRRTTFDLDACATFTELISKSAPYTLATQIRHELHTGGRKIVGIDTIAATTGAWLFNASRTLEYVKNETWGEIPGSRQDKRETLKRAGDAYLDMWSNATSQLDVPWGTPCARLEGSVYTGTGSPTDSCKPGIPSNHSQAPNTHRRYVIDPEFGSVSIFCVWEHMMNAADSHEFRLENGTLRYVHTMTECGGKVCRL